ncbi:MAG: glycosyltransferase [Candidatus Pacearchaeota archaeon]
MENVTEYLKSCFLSSFPPRECGIATFTKDLAVAMDKRFNPKLKSKVIAINESENFYNYGKNVVMEMRRDDIESYLSVAKKVNNSENIKLICIQHEFGLFGGEYGNYLIPFLDAVNKPVVIVYHSVLENPDEARKKVVRAISSRCSAIVVMANIASDILVRDYGIEKEKIHVVHHGIPDVPFQNNEKMKKKLKLEGKMVLSTFGLLSEGKGIEYMIKALPSLIKKYPNLVYLVIGETHPVVRRAEGERYRNSLVHLVKKLGLKDHVRFYNKYFTLKEIISYLLASDVYVCTNLERSQISSGTLSYALGCGRAVVSTPIIYAEEILSNNRGLLAEFRKPESFANTIDKVLSNEELRKNIEREAYTFGRSMIWSNVAFNYLNIFNQVVQLREDVTEKFPKIKLNHLRNMTDNFGIIQFSNNADPDKSSGYTLDDNSRALIVSVLYDNLYNNHTVTGLVDVYLKFLKNAQEEDGNFRNNFYNDNEITDSHSQDSFARAIWALGYTIEKSKNPDFIEQAKIMFNKSLDKIIPVSSPRANAYALIGLCHYNKIYPNEIIKNKIIEFADYLVRLYEEESSDNWQWFESYLTYANAKLSESLFFAYEETKNEKYFGIAKKTLDFLSNLVFIDGCLAPIGQSGWYKKNGQRAFFDQQPLDASSMVIAYLTTYNITKEKEDYNKAILSFNWYLGKNYLKQMIYNETTGGCHDGLGKYSINLNQGAESTVSYLMARLFLEEFKRNKTKKE